MGFSKIVFDEYLDCGAEAYIDDSMGNNINISSTTSNLLYSLMLQKDKGEKKELSTVKYQVVPIDDIFESIVRGDTKPLSSINFGDIPVITTQESDNGIAGYYDVGKATIYSDMITISANGSSCKAFYHPYKFSANPDVLVCKVKEKYNDLEIKMFIASAINQSGWRFSYYRKCTQQKLRKDVQISLPVKNNGEIDKEYIKDTIRKTVGFNELKEYLETLPV